MIKQLWAKITDTYSTPKQFKPETTDDNISRMVQLMLAMVVLGIYWLCCDLFFKPQTIYSGFAIQCNICLISVCSVFFVISLIFYLTRIKSIFWKQLIVYLSTIAVFVLIFRRLLILNQVEDVGFLITSIIYVLTFFMALALLYDITSLLYFVCAVLCCIVMQINLGKEGRSFDIYNIFILCVAFFVINLNKRRISGKAMRQKVQVQEMNCTLEIQAQQLQLQQIELNEANDQLIAQKEALEQHEANLEQEVMKQTAQLRERNDRIMKMQNHTIIALSTLVENRDSDTGNHVKRTATYVRELTSECVRLNIFPELDSQSVELFEKAAPLHDIGKIVVPDYILKKQGKLTDEEYTAIKQHTLQGGRIVREILDDGENELYVQAAYEIATYHHEKYDGTGYPYGLTGEGIPICARIMAIADVFDALVSKRCYKESLDLESAFDFIKNNSGSHFDPDLVNVFLGLRDQIIAIKNQYED